MIISHTTKRREQPPRVKAHFSTHAQAYSSLQPCHVERPPFPPPTGEYSDHAANCHCGRVKFTFSISPPLGEDPVVVYNCSICQRNGYLLVYPTKEKVKLQEGSEEAMWSYIFANKNVKHKFCKECGSSVFFEVLKPPQEAVTEAEGRGETLPVTMGVNVSSLTLSTSTSCYHSSLWLIY